ncbi:hypothetical protein LZ31DRAFT_82766 [Colletotrichum somersetense]|nr:hypothetical protein LZ31DRAFT_82766 [Colletotrichum somersetense]
MLTCVSSSPLSRRTPGPVPRRARRHIIGSWRAPQVALLDVYWEVVTTLARTGRARVAPPPPPICFLLVGGRSTLLGAGLAPRCSGATPCDIRATEFGRR